MSLTWCQCPFCRESHDIHRTSPTLEITVQTTQEKKGKLHTKIGKQVKCGFCGKTWNTTEPTFEEALGRDGFNTTSF